MHEFEHLSDRIICVNRYDFTRGKRAQRRGLAKFLINCFQFGDGAFRRHRDVLHIPEAIVNDCVAQFTRFEQKVDMTIEVATLGTDVAHARRKASATTFARFVEHALEFAINAVVGRFKAFGARAVAARSRELVGNFSVHSMVPFGCRVRCRRS